MWGGVGLSDLTGDPQDPQPFGAAVFLFIEAGSDLFWGEVVLQLKAALRSRQATAQGPVEAPSHYRESIDRGDVAPFVSSEEAPRRQCLEEGL